ncbi:DUF2397 family protein [Lichenicoccus sp.]|uniref:DUF2397 family protein n=1 Tax=Lichenicoccus sp. TaxID=2781899 RepID=UPI003D103ECD
MILHIADGSVDLFRHVSAEKARVYRAIMDVFAAAKRQYRLQLRPDEVLAKAGWPDAPPRIEELNAALGQLAEWGNLETHPDTARGRDRHFSSLKQLPIDPEDRFTALTALAEWTGTLQGDNPAQRLLQSAYEEASRTLARRGAALETQQQSLEAERRLLEDERERLQSGDTMVPPLPYTRGATREVRDGAPLWQLVDFRDVTTAQQRAGLEAALEAAGLLDAWIAPDYRIQAGGDGAPLHDTQLLARRESAPSLAAWLEVTVPRTWRNTMALWRR